MKSKEDMIDAMAMAISEVYGCKPDGSLYDSNMLMAEAALKALCGALPEYIGEGRNVCKRASAYEKLKQWGAK